MHVVISQSTTSNSKYHTDECENLPEQSKMISEEEARRRGMVECKFCSGEYEKTDGGRKSLRELLRQGEIDYE